ncbi:type I-PGING CRISPR-associated protein Cas5p [Tannerella forsythia]|uniref:type I-PGING CRISPR-associated protein Cas5p n=1 Tax=Tannerella forsythia TaxID=28112 RepID=UPI000618A21F|nr:type I-PGING CRISPR-associated protein Cas5p [Tannerella forsythia]BAR49589.1 CRISPR-associated protein, Cas5p family [Tannerella forsythia 3313]
MYTSKIDLAVLQKIPHKIVKTKLVVEPLAPLSMVSEMPGSFYKTLNVPSKKMICGLIENVLGWHIDWRDRKVIQQDIKELRKRQKAVYSNEAKGSTYIPLLMEYFDIIDQPTIDFSEVCFFNDLWKRCYRRADEVVHPKGTDNIDYRYIPQKWKLKRDEKNREKVDDKALKEFFKEKIDFFPMYYTTPTVREYIHLHGRYIIPMLMDEKLFTMLYDILDTNNIGYLGNNEGWVNLKLSKNE